MVKPSEASPEGADCLLDGIADPDVRRLAIAIRDVALRMRSKQLLVPALESDANHLIGECLRAHQEGPVYQLDA